MEARGCRRTSLHLWIPAEHKQEELNQQRKRRADREERTTAGGPPLTWKAASYLARASATDAVGGNMNQRWTATQRFQSSSEHTFTAESEDCQTCSADKKPDQNTGSEPNEEVLYPKNLTGFPASRAKMRRRSSVR